MFIYNINPVLLNAGSLQIRYYGLFYVIGFIVAYFMLKSLFKNKIKITNEKIEDLLVYAGIFGIIGARLFYVFVYDGMFYFKNPLEILAIWHGGLSFHGGLIGAIIGVYLFAKKYKYGLLDLLDSLVVPFAFALGLGRIGNFINGELYGRITNLPWCIDFGDGLCRHPSQLYESLYSFVIFGILFSLRNKKTKKGTMFGLFIVLYSAFRFVTEFFRQPDYQIGFILGLTTGQILCAVMFIIGILFLFKINRNIKKK